MACQITLELVLVRLHLSRLKHQRHPVIAPALAGRLRAVVEHVAVMATAARAVIFLAGVNQFEIGFLLEGPSECGEKAGPAGAGIEFHFAGEEWQVAACAVKNTLALFIVQGARERALCAFVAQDLKLLRRETLFPFGFSESEFFDFVHRFVRLLKGDFDLIGGNRLWRLRVRCGG